MEDGWFRTSPVSSLLERASLRPEPIFQAGITISAMIRFIPGLCLSLLLLLIGNLVAFHVNCHVDSRQTAMRCTIHFNTPWAPRLKTVVGSFHMER